jgi:hypothetical protein
MKRLYLPGMLGLGLLAALLLVGWAWGSLSRAGLVLEAPSSQAYPYPSPLRGTGTRPHPHGLARILPHLGHSPGGTHQFGSHKERLPGRSGVGPGLAG